MGHGRGLWVSRPHLASFAPLLITLRGAQVRRISWVRGVRPVGGSASGLLMKLFPTGQLFPPVAARTETKRAPTGRPFLYSRQARLFDLGFAELNVLLGDRIVFLLGDLIGHRARVLLGHVVVAGVGARHELDFDGGGFRHDKPRLMAGV